MLWSGGHKAEVSRVCDEVRRADDQCQKEIRLRTGGHNGKVRRT
jgi:hypothetical protein